ncbi:MAG: hypothetical protein IH947_07265, partial [Bacteroidetes bacterium]|nr:hypothetical protein [Bacteroidota bacterium]
MKKLLLLSFTVIASLSVSLAQPTIYTADNNPGAIGGVNVFTGATAFAGALAASANGDIIYVIPSGTNYGVMLLTKEVTVYGVGYNPDNQIGLKSLFSSVQISASNTRISGIQFTDLPWAGVAITIAANIVNTTIDKCVFSRFVATGTGIGTIMIQNCLILQNSANYGAQMFIMNTATPNIRFLNNIVFSTVNTGWGILYGLNGANIENNLFIASASGTLERIFGTVTSSSIKNNIFYGMTPMPASTFTGNTIDYNLTFGSTDNNFLTTGNTVGSNNIINQDPLFVNVPYGQAWFFTNDATFQALSPATGAGSDGTDIGLYGGGTPYDEYGTPLPVVQAITTPAMISQGTNLPVNIKGRG